MHRIQVSEKIVVRFQKSAGYAEITLEPGRDYVIAGAQFERIANDLAVRDHVYKISRLESCLPPFHVKARKQGSQRLLFFNGSGGYGDQVISWPVVKWLAAHGYEVSVMAEPGNTVCWSLFPFVKAVYHTPMPYEQMKMFDYVFMAEWVSNLSEHKDQPHPVDTLFTLIGAEPDTIPASQKSIPPVFSHREMSFATSFLNQHQKIGLYQLSAANTVRALPPGDSAFLASQLAREFPETHWLCLYDEFVPKEYVTALQCPVCKGSGTWEVPSKIDLDGNVVSSSSGTVSAPCLECRGSKLLAPNLQPIRFDNLRELWAFTYARASIVVAPDSMMVHVAGSMGVPCVGLWGPVAPANRVKYYANHYPIWHNDACPHAPCFAYTAGFPRYCPPRGNGTRTVCEVMAAITPSTVVEAVKKIRR